jgi:SpoVK/Ycf46/Vps4 family AAA+-type ATPase
MINISYMHNSTSLRLTRYQIDGRVMLDRVTFKKLNMNYQFPVPATLAAPVFNGSHAPIQRRPSIDNYGNPIPVPYIGHQPQRVQSNNRDEGDDHDLSDEELILASAVVYGFSLSDKIWLEFNVQNIQDVVWNDEAFANLVIPSGRKALLQSLVEAHHRESFDDFIKGKGQGLVINLFGPPGVGKTFSAEATSEHVKRPLYIVGAGELGTKAIELNMALERVFDLATKWKAIILIDEADVFLERRSLHDIERNAMVAVFLRHLEYYQGIMFLTTNRVKAFDEACLSRIHVALHFSELSESSKAQVWAAFLAKVGAKITEEQLRDLSSRNVNGRQIKNAARTAQSLAVGRGEKVAYSHFVETLNAMNEFTTQFEAIQSSASV